MIRTLTEILEDLNNCIDELKLRDIAIVDDLDGDYFLQKVYYNSDDDEVYCHVEER